MFNTIVALIHVANITLCVNKCTCCNMSEEQLLQSNETDVNMKSSAILVLSVLHCIRLDIFMQYLINIIRRFKHRRFLMEPHEKGNP